MKANLFILQNLNSKETQFLTRDKKKKKFNFNIWKKMNRTSVALINFVNFCGKFIF